MDRKAQLAKHWSSQRLNSTFWYKIFYHTITFLGQTLCYWLIRILTPFVMLFKISEVKASYNYWKIVTGKKGLRILPNIYWHFLWYGYMFVDRILIYTGKEDHFKVTVKGWDRVQKYLDKKEKIILLTFHFGNWELGGWFFNNHRNLPFAIVMLPVEGEEVLKIILSWQGENSPMVITLDNNPLKALSIVRALKSGFIVGMQGDRVISNSYELVEFFGRIAPFPIGPIFLSMVTGAILVPTFCLKLGKYEYQIVLEEPITIERVKREERRKVIKENLQKIAKLLEAYVKRYPFLWGNFYPFWDIPESVLSKGE